MSVERKKSTGPASSKIVRSLVIVVALAVLMGVFAKLAMDTLNKKLGIDTDRVAVSPDTALTEENQEAVAMPEFDPVEALETGSSVWAPGWKVTPCSLFVSAESDALPDSLPESPGPAARDTEFQLLVEMWAGHSGYSPVELERVWAFSSGDTCFVDLPRSGDWQGLVRTIEGRFISYTVMFPFVAGEIVEGFEEGITVRGLSSSR